MNPAQPPRRAEVLGRQPPADEGVGIGHRRRQIGLVLDRHDLELREAPLPVGEPLVRQRPAHFLEMEEGDEFHGTALSNCGRRL